MAVAACVPVAAALSGASLASYVADRFRPSAKSDVAPATWWSVSGVRMPVIPAQWWYADVPDDAYDELLAPSALAAARDAYIPCDVTGVDVAGDGWTVGTASFGGTEINAWMPAPDRRGDLARRMMYMALMYPQRLWRGHGAMLFEDGGWPLLRPLGMELLLRWHRADPVDDRERAENSQQGGRQANLNPFVEYPQLAEYLWGEHAGEDFGLPGDPPVVPDPPNPPVSPDPPVEPVTPVALKGGYSVAADNVVWFTSPYVASDAVWSIDGLAVEADCMSLSDIGLGVHELKFSSPSGCGAVKIEIRP